MRQKQQEKRAIAEEPLVTFTYGWGRTLRLYHDYLEIDKACYMLSELVHVKPSYQCIMSVEAARLTLRFRTHDVVLRGIADIEAMRKVVVYLNAFCGESVAPIWKAENPLSVCRPQASSAVHEQTLERPLAAERYRPVTAYTRSVREIAQASTHPVTVPLLEKRTRHRSVRASVDTGESSELELEQLKVRLRHHLLPDVPVPLCMPFGERTYYTCEAAWCEESPYRQEYEKCSVATYTVKDHGTLILTNRRVIYLGRLSQLVIDYVHFIRLLALPDGLILVSGTADGTEERRNLFALASAAECACYLETLFSVWQELQTAQVSCEAEEDEEAGQEVGMTQALDTLTYQNHATHTPSDLTTSVMHPHWTYTSVKVPTLRQRSERLKIDEVDTMPLSLEHSLWRVKEEQM